uniref:Kinetochore associated 1 n=1 Tax=Callorhinchus milii TaxID=7868 RepID=A0A4W3HU79_CALMI
MWNDVELLTNDDTGSGRLNIEARGENGAALYQVDTLVKISSSEKVTSSPELHAYSSSDGCVLVVDRSVILLDQTCQSVLLQLRFDTAVDVVGLCLEGQFLMVGERNGNLHLLHVKSRQTLLTNVSASYFFNIRPSSSAVPLVILQPQPSLVNSICSCAQGAGDCVLSKWKVDPVEKGITISSKPICFSSIDVKKCQILDNLLFVLDHSNLLSMWDVCALVMVWSWPSVHIQDFLLTSEGDSSALTKQENANLKLVALTAQNDKWMRNLLVYSLPTMNLLYSLEVAGVSALVQTGITQDTIYVLEGVYESQKRLSRLLHKHKFEEAERFAIQFGLDVELVYKVELNIVLENLASTAMTSRSPSSWQGIVNDAKENLHKIQDDQFVVKYCMDVAWPTFETTLEMLNYAKNRVSLVSLVLRTQARLVTFHGMFGPAQFSGNTWIEFLNNEDLFNDFLMQLQGGNLTCAQYLWLRHQVEFESKFDVKRLENLLNCITANTPSHDLCLWFKNVIIPFVLRIVPRGKVAIIARWLEHRARSLELIEKAHWPENGLQMAELYFVARNPNDLGLATSWLWIPVKEETDCEEMHQLKKLVNNLQELVNLHRKYNCRLALSEFEKETTATIVFRMLDRVLAPELIPSTLEKVIQPYINKHSLQREELLLQYIKDLLERCSSRSASLFETAWEAKAMAVLGCMTDTEVSKPCVQDCHLIYLLQPYPVDYSAKLLSTFATASTSPFVNKQLTFAHRSRALQCLLHIADSKMITAISQQSIEKVKSYLKCCIYLAEFEMLNIPYTTESFHNSAKEGMIKGLWKNHNHEPRAVRLVTELSLEYGVFDQLLWNGILQKLLGFNMNNYLRKVLMAITAVHALWQVWQCFALCPVLLDVDLFGIAKQFAQLELSSFSLGCLLLVPYSEKKEQQIQRFLVSVDPVKVLQQVVDHMSTGEVAGFGSKVKTAAASQSTRDSNCCLLPWAMGETPFSLPLKARQ